MKEFAVFLFLGLFVFATYRFGDEKDRADAAVAELASERCRYRVLSAVLEDAATIDWGWASAMCIASGDPDTLLTDVPSFYERMLQDLQEAE